MAQQTSCFCTVLRTQKNVMCVVDKDSQKNITIRGLQCLRLEVVTYSDSLMGATIQKAIDMAGAHFVALQFPHS